MVTKKKEAMERLARISASFREIWHSALNLFHPHSRGRGYDKIYRDVQACGYGDVQVMWSILHQNTQQAPISQKSSSSPTTSTTSTTSSSSSSSSSSSASPNKAQWPRPSF